MWKYIVRSCNVTGAFLIAKDFLLLYFKKISDLKKVMRLKNYKETKKVNAIRFFRILGGYRPLLAIACQPPGTANAVPIRIAWQSVLASLARHDMIAELRLPAALKTMAG